MNKLKIISINTRGLCSPRKVQNVLFELNLLKCDIVLLQETHVSCRKKAIYFERLWTGQCLWSFGIGKSTGVACFFVLASRGKLFGF